jgi:hypothetical protein
MAKFYAMQIKMGKMAIDGVPKKWKAATKKLLEQ